MKKIIITIILISVSLGLMGTNFYSPPDSVLWNLQINLPVSPEEIEFMDGQENVRSALYETLSSQLENINVNISVSYDDLNYLITIEGNNIDELREILYEKLEPQYNILNHAADIIIDGNLEESKLLLETNPSSGYFWNIYINGGNALNDNEYVQNNLPVGTSYTQIIYLKDKIVDNSVSLSYRRVWETEPPTSILHITTINSVDIIDLSTTKAKNEISEENFEELESLSAVSPEYDFPDTLDWRDYIRMPYIRNQGGCGACWAFATVGAMEIAMIMQGRVGGDVDLSEQFLISCNKDGFDCNGGYYVHQYHKDTLGKNQSKIGAVLESALPYVASNGTCKSNLKHPYKLQNYQFIPVLAPGYIASNDQIKDAIYKYGAVTSGVVVDSDFSRYAGGIYAKDVQGTVNHGLIIIGWGIDPVEGEYWILRNSWGSAWGENGYMRIKTGISKIGYRASYVVYNSSVTGADWINNDEESVDPVEDNPPVPPVVEFPDPMIPLEKFH